MSSKMFMSFFSQKDIKVFEENIQIFSIVYFIRDNVSKGRS